MPAVNLRHIEIFHAVMTTGNLTEAARMLHTSQPTVSRELARFEKVLGLTLFSRTRGRLQPTVQGLRLFEEVQRSWYGLDRIVSAAESHQQKAQPGKHQRRHIMQPHLDHHEIQPPYHHHQQCQQPVFTRHTRLGCYWNFCEQNQSNE